MSTNVADALAGGMTVGELVEALRRHPADARVVMGCDYGDRHHTEQALPVGRVDALGHRPELITASAYSASGLAVRDLSDYEDDAPEGTVTEGVVVLRMG